MRLRGAAAIVTGGASGLGDAAVGRLAEAGARDSVAVRGERPGRSAEVIPLDAGTRLPLH